MPKVSVIIPSYNHGAYIHEAIQSVLQQTCKDLEIIVVDDGSTDNTREVVRPFVDAGQVTYFYQSNRGLSAARNAGIRLARGQYIKLLDSDDFLYPEQIERQLQDVQNDPQAVSLTDCVLLKPGGKTERLKVYLVSKEKQFASFIESNRGVVHAFLIPKHLIEKAGGFDESLTCSEDTDLWIRILRNGAYVKHLPYPGCVYRILSTSMSSNTENMFLQKCKIYEKVNRSFLNEDVTFQPLINSLLVINTRLMHEGIARKKDLDALLPSAMVMSGRLFDRQKKGVLKAVYKIIGLKNYMRLHLLAKSLFDKGYVFDLLNHNYRWKYEEASGAGGLRLGRLLKRINHRGIVLMYHRVADLKCDPFGLAVSPAHFEEHMRVLKKYGRPVLLRDMAKRLGWFSLGAKEIAVTFDDGYADNYLNAVPILERHEVPAAFFLVSGHIGGGQLFWWDELEAIIYSGQALPASFDMTVKGVRYHWPVKAGAYQAPSVKQSSSVVPQNNITLTQNQLFYALWQVVNQVPFTEKKAVLRQIAQWAGVQPKAGPENSAVTVEQLRAMAGNPLFELGAHTVWHPMLTHLGPGDQEREIGRSKMDIEELAGRRIETFTYPHGKFSARIVKFVRAAGFRGAATVIHQAVTRGGNPLLLPRVQVFDWDGDEFERNLKKWVGGAV